MNIPRIVIAAFALGWALGFIAGWVNAKKVK
jgi:hypothetical protein